MYSNFVLLENSTGEVRTCEKLSLGDTAGRDEAWLQTTLNDYPEILPIADIDSGFGPLIPLCRELRTTSGPIDNVFINAAGKLTLVECKLWRNPEARRKVVAQILDYASAISKWSYSDLQGQVSQALGKRGTIPFELVKEKNPNISEAQFVDEVSKNLRKGHFLLLLAGDGIREDVAAIANLLNRNSTSKFQFGVVEVALYGVDEAQLLIQPRVLLKTTVIERHVVIANANGSEADLVEAEIEVDLPNETQTQQTAGQSKHQENAKFWAPVTEVEFTYPELESPKHYWPNHVRAPTPDIPELIFPSSNALSGERPALSACP